MNISYRDCDNACRLPRTIPSTRQVLHTCQIFSFRALACSNICTRDKSWSHLPAHFHNAGTDLRATDLDVESASGHQAILADSIRENELQRGSTEGKTLLTRSYVLNSAALSVIADEGEAVQNVR